MAKQDYSKLTQQQIIDRVLVEIKSHVESGDLTAIEEMIKSVPLKDLINFLPEDLKYKVGDRVQVTPKRDDVFQNEFVGLITGTHSTHWMVEDQDGDTWDADEDQMLLVGEE
jgi:hypothetical protein